MCFLFVNKKYDDKDEILKEVESTRERIKHAENMLDFTYEPELIESAVLEIESARKKYNFLLKKIKQYEEKPCTN